MRLRSHVPLLQSTLKYPSTRQFGPSLCIRCRRYASTKAQPEKIAVLGGGVSGLASAYFVSKEFPKAKITVYESGESAGGWLKSRRVDVPGGNVLFEYGPRTLRPGPNCLPTAQLIQDLGLVDNVLYAKKTAAGSKNRFIYYPDRLNRLPSPGAGPDFVNLFSLAQSGLMGGVYQALFEAFKPKRPDSLTDESIGSFIARRVDRRLADNLVSAVMHGIYAGDVWQLSARTLLEKAWTLEGQDGSIINGIFNTVMKDPERTWMHPYDADALDAMHEDFSIEPKFAAELKDSAMFSFRNGIQQLITTLQQNLEDSNQVEFRLRTHVQDLKYIGGEEPQMQVSTTPTGDQTSTPELESYDLVLSSRRDPSLAPTVTVMTVNLFYPVPNLAPVTGFGYLIPQSVPFAQNPERALGVIFDSDAIVGQDTASGTKLTVMLGGHWWDGWESYPSEEEGVEMAKAVVERHLGIVGEPVVSHARLARDCIPQYTVGFDERLKAYAEKVKNDYRGRVRMVGNLYHGVGVNDCIRAAWSVACGLRGSGWRDRATGLERVSDVRDWTYYRYRE